MRGNVSSFVAVNSYSKSTTPRGGVREHKISICSSHKTESHATAFSLDIIALRDIDIVEPFSRGISRRPIERKALRVCLKIKFPRALEFEDETLSFR